MATKREEYEADMVKRCRNMSQLDEWATPTDEELEARDASIPSFTEWLEEQAK